MIRTPIFSVRNFKIVQNTFKSISAMTSVPEVLVTRADSPEDGIRLLQSKCKVDIYEEKKPMPRDQLLQRVKGKQGLMCLLTDKVDAELLDAAGPSLKVIGTFSVGYDHIDLDECKKRGVSVGNTPNVLTDATAELSVALLLATARRLIEASQEVTNGGWAKCAWGPLYLCGTSLVNSTVGIVGLGRIGYGVAERLKSFKVKQILYSGNKPKVQATEKLNAKFVPLDELLQSSDYVIVCAALTPETERMFDLQAFRKMKRSAIFINSSRGKIVDHEALYSALESGMIAAAGLDVVDPEPLPTDHKLTRLKNCVLLPHIGSATVETRNAMAVLAAKNILAGLEGKPLPCPL